MVSTGPMRRRTRIAERFAERADRPHTHGLDVRERHERDQEEDECHDERKRFFERVTVAREIIGDGEDGK